MQVLTTFHDRKLTLYLRGELDHHAAKEAMRRIEQLLDEYLPRDCALDMAQLTFMDSSGIALILRTHKRLMQMGGRAWVENASPQALRVIDASGIDRIIRIIQSAGGITNES